MLLGVKSGGRGFKHRVLMSVGVGWEIADVADPAIPRGLGPNAGPLRPFTVIASAMMM
jgi:hypothetical protein